MRLIEVVGRMDKEVAFFHGRQIQSSHAARLSPMVQHCFPVGSPVVQPDAMLGSIPCCTKTVEAPVFTAGPPSSGVTHQSKASNIRSCAGSIAVGSRTPRNKIFFPSGDQIGNSAEAKSGLNSRGCPPEAGITKILLTPGAEESIPTSPTQ